MDTRQFVVSTGEAGERLDRWLTRKMPDFSRGQIKHLLDQGRVLVNQRRVLIAGWELESEDAIEVRIPLKGVPDIRDLPKEPLRPRRERPDRVERFRNQEVNSADEGKRRPSVKAPTNSETEKRSRKRFLEVLFEDRDIIVVNKPAGVLTEPKSDSPHDHLLGMIRGYLKRKHKGSRASFVKLIHRLDCDTTGVMVAAKSRVGEQLEDQFRNHRVDRQYLGIVQGRVEKEEGSISIPLEKGDFHSGRKVRTVKEGGMKAVTGYRVKERYAESTLLQIQVQTGRTHQVRVHLAEIGHPLAGDKLYGGRMPFGRHALHATRLQFQHPRTKKSLRFEAKLPEDMTQLIDQLRGA